MFKYILLLSIYINFVLCSNYTWNTGWKASEYGINQNTGAMEDSDLNSGACSNTIYYNKKIKLDDPIVAFPSSIYKKYCGKYIIVINEDKNITKKLMVLDECVGCGEKQIDIPATTWNKLYGYDYYILNKVNPNAPGYIKNIKWRLYY